MVRSRLEIWVPWKRFLLIMLYSLPLLSLLCAHQGERSEAQDLPQVKIPSSVAPDDGQWRMAPKDYANLRYSELDQITPENIKNLHVAFTFSTGVTQGHEAAPLVVDNTMYIVTPYPDYLYAMDLTQPGASLKWKYEPKPAAAAQGVACCDHVNRGAAYASGRIFYNTLDGHTVAVDAQTGKEIWKTKLGDINTGETITMAPLVMKDKVLVGNSGGEMGVRGWLTALSTDNGQIAWKAYNTGPDTDVLIGPNFKPFYAQDQGHDLGVSTWPPDAWQTGGGTVWGWISYDPELNLIYHGTANPGPWRSEQRPGDNIRNTLKAATCDLLMGVPKRLDAVLTTSPYYRSTYVFVYRQQDGPSVHSLDDPILHTIKIGVQLIGDDGANSPPAHTLARRHITENVVGYSVYGDYAQPNPTARIIEAVVTGAVDVAVVWGPIAGYLARSQPVSLAVVPVIPSQETPALPFTFDIALGVRRGEEEFRAALDAILQRRRPEINRLLNEYGVPRMETSEPRAAAQ